MRSVIDWKEILSKLKLSWKGMYILSLTLVMLSYILSGLSQFEVGRITLEMGIIVSVVAFILFVKLEKRTETYVPQLFVCYFLMSSFLLPAILSAYSQKKHMDVIVVECLGIFFPCVYLFLEYIISIEACRELFGLIKKYILLLGIVCLFILFSVEVLDDWLIMDSCTYYTYTVNAKELDFTFETIELLKLGGHQSYGVGFLYLIGEFITPCNPIGVRIVQIISVCTSVFMLSSIIRKLELDDNNSILNALYCSAFLFAPLVLGTIYSINLDFMMMCFWVWLVYFWLMNQKILFFLSVIFLIFSKEVGIVIYAGFAFGAFFYFIGDIVDKKMDVKKFVQWLIMMGMPVLIFLLSWFFGGHGWFASRKPLAFSASGSVMHKFGWNTTNFIMKIKEMFFLNFSWIITLFLIFVGIFFLIRKHRVFNINSIIKSNWYPILFSYLFFFVFNIFYITYTHSRYIMPHLFIFALIWVYAMKNLRVSVNTKKILAICVSALMLVQSFITIDPITLRIFRNVNVGTRNVVSTVDYTIDYATYTITTDDDAVSERVFSHGMEYNRERTYFGEAFGKMLKKIEYTPDKLIMVECIYGDEFSLYIALSSVIWFSKEGGNDAEYYYNPKTYKIVFDSSYPKLNILFVDKNSTDLEQYLDLYEDVFIISFPYKQDYEEFCAVKSIKFSKEYSIDYRGWRVDARKLEK